jgi:selenocysteine-specific elongation factor
MPVDRAFTVRGTGTVVTGTVWSGELPSESNVRVLPSGKVARVRRIEQHGQTCVAARAGNRAAVALAGVELSEIGRGSVLVGDELWRPTDLFEALLDVDPSILEKSSARTRFRIHAGASEAAARMVVGARDDTGETLVRIATDAPMTLRGGDRFVLRLPAPIRTVGGGVVVDPYARKRSLSRDSGPHLSAAGYSPLVRLGRILEAEVEHGVAIADIPVRVGCSPAEVAALIEKSDGWAGTHNLFSPPAVEQVMASVRRIVAEYEIKSPLALGVPARTLREGLRVSEELADIAIREMEDGCEVESFGPLLRKPGWTPTPSARDSESADRLAHDICAGEAEPPSVSELVARYGSSVPGLLRFLERQGRIVQVETERFYDRETLESLIKQLRTKLVPGEVYAPGQLRDVLGFSRKYLIPFLEFCDRSGITERRGVGRVLRGTTGVLLDTSQAHS